MPMTTHCLLAMRGLHRSIWQRCAYIMAAEKQKTQKRVSYVTPADSEGHPVALRPWPLPSSTPMVTGTGPGECVLHLDLGPYNQLLPTQLQPPVSNTTPPWDLSPWCLTLPEQLTPAWGNMCCPWTLAYAAAHFLCDSSRQ